ncbi:hypothetical protein PRK78_005728 [Emydomyces testavorans]|uniref:Uncharacterized protein n=1 Tax=Emydomyces testavorans TaxID=2070801 RepID=A0AAF0DKS6_9EURO|nr:hypothetical protein PRK78_005728 [Emydomyces testavorans]
MAGYHPDYLHDDRARTGSGSPLTPFSPTQPPSFKTNVNRKKTKRWVNAKTYTYDGDDWGDSGDDDAADADSDPRQSHAPSVPEDRDGLGKPPARFPEPTNRSSSASSVTRRQIPAGAARFQTEQMSVPNYQEDNSPKPLPFVRPADIYKRLSEEREKQRMKVAEASRASHESDRHSEAASAQHVPPLTQRNALQRPTFPQDRSEQISSPNHSFDNTPQPPSGSADGSQRFAHATNPIDTPKTTNKDDKATDLPQVTIDNPPGLEPFTTPDQVAKLPELRRLSDFADDFMNPAGGQPVQDSRAAQETSAEPSSQTSELDRNRSLGFRSVVHQAFDVPDTPTTDTGSIARSDSNTTSLISPIIRSNTMSFAAENRAPTIQEEPVEQDVQNVASRSQTPPVLGFKPGHRRSLTPPNSNNSPARRPVVTAGEPMFRSESARTLDASSAESKYRPDSDTTQTQAEPSIKSHHSAAEAAKDAAPSYQQSNESESAKNHQQTPQPPTLDTRPLPPETRVSPSSADPSSANELNDRLRDEIIRSLTPSSSIQAEDAQPLTSSNVGHEPRSRIRHESTLIPSAYDSYWNEQSGLSFSSSPVSPVDPSACTNPQINAEQNSPLPQAREGEEMLQPLDRNPDTTSNVAHPPLKKKFSWEMDSEEDEPAPSADEPQPKPQISVVGPTTQMPIATDTIRKVEDTDSNFPQGHVFEHADRRSSVMTGADPATPVAEEVLSDPCPKSPKEPLATLSPSDDAKLLPEHGPSGPSVNAPAVDSEKLLGFREIMSLKTSNQKIAAFNRTREQFAATDTGLQDWLRQAAENLSEHADLVQRNGELPPGSSISHKSTTSRSKFPILSSGSGPSRTHIRHASGTPLSSMMHSQQVQAKGKDLLHSAGVLGGKAGDAAKGLFAKGRNKFRHSGSADKVDI